MIKQFSLLFFFFFCVYFINAQTFNGTGGLIPDAGASPTCFPVNVTGVGTINSTYGLASVCLNITHSWDADLEIYLTSPDGSNFPLSIQNGSSGSNYTGTCFTGTAAASIAIGTAPFPGDYIPETPLGIFNNGQNANGVWKLCIQDVFGLFSGSLNNWSITFNNTPAPQPPIQPVCNGNSPAGDNCGTAIPVCNFDGYCGNTSSSYAIDQWPELASAFCGNVDNNSFVTFVASASTATFNVWVFNSQNGDGIQMMFYSSACGSGPVTSYGCYYQINPGPYPNLVTATGLTPGNTYFLMFDGYAGDVCDYTIGPISGVNVLAVSPTAATVCAGQTVTLTASGGNGTYSWTGAGLQTNSGSVVTATVSTPTTYTVTSLDPTGSCPITKDVIVSVPSPPAPPIVSSPITLCQGLAASPLTATGTGLIWYLNATSLTGSAIAPTPSTSVIGSSTYYVSQSTACDESIRVPLTVNVVAQSPAPMVSSPVVYCQGSSAATALTAIGTGLLWYTSTGTIGSAIAPIPSTGTPGNTTYYVSQNTGSCGESIKATITVTIKARPLPPVVTTPLILCLGSPAAPLTATGTGLLWYASLSAIGNASAPSPSTSTLGNTTYYVSQTVNGCESLNSSITVTVSSLSPAPVVSPNTLTYCQGISAPALLASGSNLLWYTATSATGTSTPISPSTAIAGTFTYYVTQTINCGESPKTAITVIIQPAPAAPIVTSPIVYCQGVTSSPLSAVGSNLLWYNNLSIGSIGNSTAPTPITNSIGTTNYYVSATTGVCEGPRSLISVLVNVAPAAPNVISPVKYCQHSSVAPLTATGSLLLWYNLPANGLGNTTAPVPSSSQNGTKNFYVSQTIGQCESPRALIEVVIDPNPNLGPDLKDSLCFNESFDLTAEFNTTGLSCIWTKDGIAINNPTNVTESGTYKIIAANSIGCSDTAMLTFSIQPRVIAHAGNDTIAVKNSPHQLFGSGGKTYSWSPSSPLNYSSIANPTATLQNDQLFVLTAYNEKGCIGRDSIFLKVYNGPTYFLPKAFTPDGDGLNDIFRAVPVGIASTEYFKIFNRDGNLIFKTNQWLSGWDGNYLGKKQSPGSYVWVIKGNDKNGNPVEMKGTVLLMY